MPLGNQVRIVFNHPITGECIIDEQCVSVADAATRATRLMDKVPKPYRVSNVSLRHWKPGPKTFDSSGTPLGYHRDKYDPHCFIWIGPGYSTPMFSPKSQADLIRDLNYGGKAPTVSENKPEQPVMPIQSAPVTLIKTKDYERPDKFRASFCEILQPSQEPEVFVGVNTVNTIMIPNDYKDMMTKLSNPDYTLNPDPNMKETVAIARLESNLIFKRFWLQKIMFLALSDWIMIAFSILDEAKGCLDPIVGNQYKRNKLQPFVLPLTKVQAFQIQDINLYMSKNKDSMFTVPTELFNFYEEKLFEIESLFYDQYKSEYIRFTEIDHTYKPLFSTWEEEEYDDRETQQQKLAREKRERAREQAQWVDFNRVAYRRRDENGNYYYTKKFLAKTTVVAPKLSPAEEKTALKLHCKELNRRYANNLK